MSASTPQSPIDRIPALLAGDPPALGEFLALIQERDTLKARLRELLGVAAAPPVTPGA